jgi:gamma-glutamyltranspeptidase/glutathione hydrolase
MSLFDWDFPYSSQRMPVMARNVVATSQPLAAQAGLTMLFKGGNAVDAALAAAITLTIVEPTSNGIGGDAFAMVWDGQRLHGINGSGRSPAAWTYERFAHLTGMPLLGWDSVTVPGAVSVWTELSGRFGRLPFEDLFESAIGNARDGFPVTPMIARAWESAPETYRQFPEFAATFLPEGRAPKAGEIFKCESQADTLREIADSKGESFYRGRLAEEIAKCSANQGGAMTREDLQAHHPEWVEPLSIDYRGYRLHELPPNGQGLAALMVLGILGHFNPAEYPVDSADSIHLQVEAMKLAFADINRHLGDPGFMVVAQNQLLDPEYLVSRAKLIAMDRAAYPASGIPSGGGTVYLAAADSDGMMVSFIQSNFRGFGSGIVIPGTGISLQNRGCGFSLEKGHPNQVDGSKRPFHTIIPAFVTWQDRPLMSFGVMGGHMQPQGHLQMMTRIFDYGQNPQAACDAPRWFVTEKMELAVEPGFSSDTLDDLSARGHRIATDMPQSLFGGAQLIYSAGDFYIAASDHRKDGLAVGF